MHLAAIRAGAAANGRPPQTTSQQLKQSSRQRRLAGIGRRLGVEREHCSAAVDIPLVRSRIRTEGKDARPGARLFDGEAMDETMAAQLCRWETELKMVGLRFSNVMEPHDTPQFPGFDAGPVGAQLEPLGLNRRPRRAQEVRKALAYQARGWEVFIHRPRRSR